MTIAPHRLIPLVVAVAVMLPRAAASQVAADGAVQPPGNVARALEARGSTLQLPPAGLVQAELRKDSPTFEMPEGVSTALLLRLRSYAAPYLCTIVSTRRGIGRTTEMFVPTGVILNEAFEPLAELGEREFQERIESLVAELRIDDTLARGRYLLLYTRGDLVGQQLYLRGRTPFEDAVGSLMQKGLFRVERSLEAKILVDVRPLPDPRDALPGTPPEIARTLLDHGLVVRVPPAGKVSHRIGARPPTFLLGGGPSSVVLLELPAFQAAYVLKVESRVQRSSVFVPRGLFLDGDFEPVAEFDETHLSGSDTLTAELPIDEGLGSARYVLLYTRGDLVGTSLRRGGAGLMSGRLRWVARSLDARLQVETRRRR